MNLKPVTVFNWMLTAVILALYLVGGIWLDKSAALETWLYRIGLTGATLAPIAFIVVYTLTHNKWWQNDLGTSLARVKLSLVPSFGVLAYVFWFHGGLLNQPYLGWLAVSGPILTTIALTYQAVIFGRISLRNRRVKEKLHELDSDITEEE